MTDDWRYGVDADEDHYLTQFRIPVTSSHPAFHYLVAFDRMSEARVTSGELLALTLLILYKRGQYGESKQRIMWSRPLDTAPGHNTIVLHKWGENDWGYRLQTFDDSGPLFFPGRAIEGDDNPRFTLLELLDRINSAGGQQHPDWVTFKEHNHFHFSLITAAIAREE